MSAPLRRPRPGRRAPVLLFAVLAVLLRAPAFPEEGELRLEPAAADREALREIVQAEDIRTAPERPGLVEYALDLGARLASAIEDRLASYTPETLATLSRIVQAAAQVVFVTALALLTATVARALFDGYRRRRERDSAEDAFASLAAPAADHPAGRSREAWAAELGRWLDASDAAAACHALWWWLASALLPGAAVAASWTSRELVARAGRRDLAPPVRRLDRMIYGADRPGVEDVRRLWSELEEAVG